MSALASSCNSNEKWKWEWDAWWKPNSEWTGESTWTGEWWKEDIKITWDPTMWGEKWVKNEWELKPQENSTWWTINPEIQEKFIYPPLWTNSNEISSKYNWFLDWGSFLLERILYRVWYSDEEQTAYFNHPDLWEMEVITQKDWNKSLVNIYFKPKKDENSLWDSGVQLIRISWVPGWSRYWVKVELEFDEDWNSFKKWAHWVAANILQELFQQNKVKHLVVE